MRGIPFASTGIPESLGSGTQSSGRRRVVRGGLGEFFGSHIFTHSETQAARRGKGNFVTPFALAKSASLVIYKGMKKVIPCIVMAVGTFLTPTAVQADLPGLKKQPWIGYFIGIEHRKKMRFGITAKGQGIIDPLTKEGKPVFAKVPFQVNFDVIETLPDGKKINKKINSDTLTSEQPATEDPSSPITFRGKVTGDAAFEVTVHPERGGVSVSGKLTDKGTLTNPVHFEISLDVKPYPRGPGDESEKIEAFEKRAKRDVLKYETLSRKRDKIEFLEETNPASAVGEPMSYLEFRTDAFDNHDFEIHTTDKAKLTFADLGSKALWNGFTLRWIVDEGADAATQKITITAK